MFAISLPNDDHISIRYCPELLGRCVQIMERETLLCRNCRNCRVQLSLIVIHRQNLAFIYMLTVMGLN
jgi:hypothetical protein